MFNKKIGIYALTLAMAMTGMTGCGAAGSSLESSDTSISVKTDDKNSENTSTADTTSTSEPFSVVCTIFPEYDWVKEILGDHADNAELTYLLDNGVDLHSYQPTADDMIKISNCDMFIYVGGESDEWVEDALAEAHNKDMKVINLMDVLGDSAKVEELKEGMQEGEHEHEHDHSKEVSDFEDNEVKDRSLSDWAGEWQSPYPFVLDGTLDEAWKTMAETKGKMTAEEYKEYYKTGYETDIKSVKINGDNITYTYDNGKSVSSDYKYTGYFIQEWSGGTRAAMYRFEAEDKNSGAPVYIEINDHMIEPAEAEHFHLRMSNESYDAIVDPEKYWPTFFPADMSGDDICDHLAGHDKDEDDHDHEHEEGEEEYDEHVWLSLKNAKLLCSEIEINLEAIDPENASDYKANLDSYEAKLSELDNSFQTLVDSSSVKTLVFGDRFPFRYFVDDYGLDYYAAFIGCSAETEASFETIAFLSNKVKKLDSKTIFTLENSSKDIANTIISTSGKNAKIAELNSLQSVSKDDIAGGASYISLMQKNYDVLAGVLK